VARPLILWLPPIVWMAVIFAASSVPDVTAIPGGVSDTLAHRSVFAVLGALFLRALAGGSWRGVTWRAVLASVASSLAYGVFDEWHQSFVPGRSSELRDVVSDLTGAAAAGAGAWAWSIIRHFSRSRERRHGLHESPPRA